MVDKNSRPIGNSAEERNDRRQRERLAELTRLLRKILRPSFRRWAGVPCRYEACDRTAGCRGGPGRAR